MNRRPLHLATLLVLVLLAGCGSEDTPESAATPEAATPTATATPSPAAGGDNTDVSVKPTIEKPSGEPPSKLVKEDIVEGKGRAAKAGDQVTVQYVGVSYSTGEQFDASWDNGQPFPFQLGQGAVIEGWDEGVPGMKVGGRRKLTIPPEQAYGPEGSPPVIGPDETLIFVVDVLDIQPG